MTTSIQSIKPTILSPPSPQTQRGPARTRRKGHLVRLDGYPAVMNTSAIAPEPA
jgi:hypothetical protein